jgi:acyl carrier protein
MADWPQRFEDVLTSHLPGDQTLQPAVPLRDQGVDSLALVGLIMDLESGFEVVIPDELVTMETFDTPESLWRMVSELIDKSAASAEA